MSRGDLPVFSLLVLLIPVLVIGGVVAVVAAAVTRSRRRSEGEGEPFSPKHVFLYLLAAATLYISAIGVLVLIWSLAEHWFPDPYVSFDYSGDGGMIRGGVSMAIVAFPIFLYLAVQIRKRTRSGEVKAGSTLRSGFIYFNLFIVAVAALCTLMVIVNAFLNGDLTPRFLVRAGGVLGIVALVYVYYRSELQAGPGTDAAARPEASS